MKQTNSYELWMLVSALSLTGLGPGCGATVDVEGAALVPPEPEPSGEVITDPSAEQPQEQSPKEPTSMAGGGCIFKDVPGQATIVNVAPAPAGENNCPNDPVSVKFSFTPDSGGTAGAEKSLTIGDGKNPPRPWVEASGLTEGSVHKCIRRDLVEGACTPLVFDFPDLDQEKGRTDCFAGTR